MNHRTITLTTILWATILFLYCHAGLASTLWVPADFATIQQAIAAAVDGDTVLVAPGTYTGEGNRNIEFLGKEVSVISEAGPEQTTIDAEGQAQYGFKIQEGEGRSALIEGFRIVNVSSGSFGTTGAIYLNRGSPTVRNCILENNNRGIYVVNSWALVQGCIIRNNSPYGGTYGGFSATNAEIKNCLIAGNYSSTYGGGIRIGNDSPTFINCTVAGNTARQSGGGIEAFEYKITMRNCIVWANDAPEAANINASFFDITYSNIQGPCLPQIGNINQDPLFADTLYHLSPMSPSIDAGSPADGRDLDDTQINMGSYGGTSEAAVGNVNHPIIESIDPGSGLPIGGETIVIRGARFGSTAGKVYFDGVEATTTLWAENEISCSAPAHPAGLIAVTVEKNESLVSNLTFGYRYEGPALLRVPSAYPTIQEAVFCAAEGDTILVAPGTYTGVGNRAIEFLGKEVIVRSEAGAAQTTIDVEGQAQFGFIIHQDEQSTAIIEGFRIINATTEGIRLNDGSATIRNCIMENNARGLRIERTQSFIENCIIRNNTPSGGILNWTSSSNTVVKNCLIANNFSSIQGGGIRALDDTPLFLNCTITENTSGRSAGGIYAESNDLVLLRNCIVWANFAPSNPNIEASESDIRYSDIQGGWPGEGNLNQDPCFADRFSQDFHLNSTSPCIDTGDPNDDFTNEPAPNGGRINMGAYGNTDEASSFEAKVVILDFSYELGCSSTRQVSITGKYFGTTPGITTLGSDEISTFDSWTDTLIQFSVDAQAIEGQSITVLTNSGERDSIPSEFTYTPFAQYVSGEVSGVWTADCPGTYILAGPVTVPVGSSLIIEPGVQVLVDRRLAGGLGGIEVAGQLIVNGRKDQPVLFSTLPFQANPGGWQGIALAMQDRSGLADLEYCTVEYARNGITVKDSDVEIRNCTIRYNSEDGVFWDAFESAVSGKLTACHIFNNQGHGIRVRAFSGGDGNAVANPEIIANRIMENAKDGIKIEAEASTPSSGFARQSASSNPLIYKNTIQNNRIGINCVAEGEWADGLIFDAFYRAFADPVVESNLIVGNQGGFQTITEPSGGNTWLSYSDPKIINCTFADNGDIGIVALDTSNVTVVNTIVVGSSISDRETDGGKLLASHSTLIPAVSGEAMVNDPPQFFNPADGDYRLLAQSPQIDSGTNEAVTQTEDLPGNDRLSDGDGDSTSTVDIGAVEYALPKIVNQTGDLEVCAGTVVRLSVEVSGEGLTYQWQKDGSPLANALQPNHDLMDVVVADQGNYTCLITDELGGQVASQTMQLTVNPLLEAQIEITSSESAVCAGDTVFLQANITNGGEMPEYTWLLNGSPAGESGPAWSNHLFQNGDRVSCLLQSSESCVQNVRDTSNSIELTVSALPDVQLSLPDTACIPDGSIMLSGGLPAGGIYSGDLVENGVFDAANAIPESFYSITYTFTDNFGCASASQEEILVSNCITTSVSTIQEAPFVQLSPNPASHFIQLVTRHFQPTSVSIYNQWGQLVDRLNQSLPLATPLRIDCSNYPKGVYFVQVSDGVKGIHKSFVVQ